jgi:hypothetical protein
LGSVVEAEFGLFEKEVEVGFRDAVVAAEGALGLGPEVLDPIDVIVAFARVGVGGINPMVMELGNVKNVIAG